MLVLKRREGEWIDVRHAASGDVLRIRVYAINGDSPGRANLAFDDSARNFLIERPERVLRPKSKSLQFLVDRHQPEPPPAPEPCP